MYKKAYIIRKITTVKYQITTKTHLTIFLKSTVFIFILFLSTIRKDNIAIFTKPRRMYRKGCDILFSNTH